MLNMLDPDEEPTLILTALEVSPDAIVNEYRSIAEIDFEYARVCGRTGRIDVYFNSCHVSCAARRGYILTM